MLPLVVPLLLLLLLSVLLESSAGKSDGILGCAAIKQ
jgi:hypothetical protein